jgi:hypothetical protein
MGPLGIILIVAGIVVNIVGWVKKKRGLQVIGILVALGGLILSFGGCWSTALQF